MPDRQRELSVNDIQQAGQFLLPVFRDAVRAELEKQNYELKQEFTKQTKELETEINKLCSRVSSLEVFKIRVMLAYGAIVAVVTVAYHVAIDWLTSRGK